MWDRLLKEGDIQEDVSYSSENRSILEGGNGKGLLPEVAAIM